MVGIQDFHLDPLGRGGVVSAIDRQGFYGMHPIRHGRAVPTDHGGGTDGHAHRQTIHQELHHVDPDGIEGLGLESDGAGHGCSG